VSHQCLAYLLFLLLAEALENSKWVRQSDSEMSTVRPAVVELTEWWRNKKYLSVKGIKLGTG
jgi:hypothetical protein